MSDYTGVLVGRKQFDAANTEDEYDGGCSGGGCPVITSTCVSLWIMCGYFVTSSRRRNHVCVPEGAQSLGRGGLFHYAGRPTFTYYIRLFALNLVDACSFSCWWWTFFFFFQLLLLVCEQSCFYPTPVTAHNLLGLCWSDANNNLWLDPMWKWEFHIFFVGGIFLFFFVGGIAQLFVGGISQLEVKAPSISWLVLLS